MREEQGIFFSEGGGAGIDSKVALNSRCIGIEGNSGLLRLRFVLS